MRLPKAFEKQLPPNWLMLWLTTKVNYFGTTYKVAVAFDVFRLILAIQAGDDVDQISIDYEHLQPFDGFQEVVERAVAYGFDHGFDESESDTTIEDLLTTEELEIMDFEVKGD